MDIRRSNRRPRLRRPVLIREVRMELLPPHDPSRRLIWAARSARGVGWLQIALAGVIVFIAGVTGAQSRRYYGALIAAFLSCLIFLVVPGLLGILFASFIEKRKRWAIISTIVLASLELVVVAPFFARALLRFPNNVVPLIVTSLFLVAIVLLIVQLSRCFGVLRTDAIDYDRGFAPIMRAQLAEDLKNETDARRGR